MINGRLFQLDEWLENCGEDVTAYAALIQRVQGIENAGLIDAEKAEAYYTLIAARIERMQQDALEMIDAFIYDRELPLPEHYFTRDGAELED